MIETLKDSWAFSDLRDDGLIISRHRSNKEGSVIEDHLCDSISISVHVRPQETIEINLSYDIKSLTLIARG